METQRDFARKLHALSRFGDDDARAFDPSTRRKQNHGIDLTWPFMCVSINFTKSALQMLRSGALNKKCNKRKDVLSVIHDFHHALFLEFGRCVFLDCLIYPSTFDYICDFRRLVADPQKHHAVHLSDLSKFSTNNPSGLLQSYKKAKAAGFSDPLQYSSNNVTTKKPAEAAGAGAMPVVESFAAFEEIEQNINRTQPDLNMTGKAARFKV